MLETVYPDEFARDTPSSALVFCKGPTQVMGTELVKYKTSKALSLECYLEVLDSAHILSDVCASTFRLRYILGEAEDE